MHAPHCILGVEVDEAVAAVVDLVERAWQSEGGREAVSMRRASRRT